MSRIAEYAAHDIADGVFLEKLNRQILYFLKYHESQLFQHVQTCVSDKVSVYKFTQCSQQKHKWYQAQH